MYSRKIKLFLSLLFLSLPNFTSADNGFSFSFTEKYRCPSKYEDCYFNITNNNHYSPKISSFYPEYAEGYGYRFINFIFYIPKSQQQKWFYLEAYDWQTKESLISNGDCYFINITEQFIYQLRFTKPINDSNPYSFIQFRFFGLDPYFFMLVQAEFRYDLYFVFRGAVIHDGYSFYKADHKELKQYLDEMQILESEQKKRKDRALKHAKIIAEKLFLKLIDTNIQYTENIYENIIIDTPFFSVTLTIQTGFDLSTEAFLKPEDNTICETIFNHGSIEFVTPSILDDKVSMDNYLLKLVSIFKNTVIDIVFSFSVETDCFSMKVSTNGYNSVGLTFKFIDPDNDTIFYEIDFKIQIKNPKLVEALVEAQEFLVETAENIGNFINNNAFLLLLALGIIVFAFIFTRHPSLLPTAVGLFNEFLKNADLQFQFFQTAKEALSPAL